MLAVDLIMRQDLKEKKILLKDLGLCVLLWYEKASFAICFLTLQSLCFENIRHDK